ncbi:hypothetical protein CON22_17895 [Bacillus cereus]|nr:hypothetical protein CON22_17895 [Bacillus cereus]
MKSKIQKWKPNNKWMFGVIVLTLFLVGSIIFVSPTYAWTWKDLFDWGLDEEETKQAIKFLNNDWIEYSTVLGAIWQSMVGQFIKGLLFIVGMLEGLIPDTFSLFDALNDVGINQFSQSIIKGLFAGIFTLIITWLGIRTMVMHKPPKFKSVVTNIIMMVVLVGGLNEIMAQMQKLSVDFYNASTEGQKYEDGLAFKLVKDNTADIIYLAQNSFDPIQGDKPEDTIKKEKNALTKEIFLKASLGDLITPKVANDIGEAAKDKGDAPKETEYLQYRLTNDGTSDTLEKIDESSFDIFKKVTDTGYKRYPMNSLTIICGLLSIGVAYAFTLFVFVSTILELVMKKVVAPLVFITDIESGQKTKMVVTDIFKGFMLIAFTGITMRVYIILVTYVGQADLSMVLYIVSMMALTMLLIKGSESILRYFGVDVGLKEGKNHLLGAWAAMKGAQALGKGATGLGRSAKEKLQGGEQSRENAPKRSEDEGTDSGEAKANTPSRSGMTRRIGTTLGYAANRGAGGMLKDAGNKVMDSANDVYEAGKSKVSNASNNVKDSVKGTVSDFKEGHDQGRQTAKQNADRDTLNQIGKDVKQNAEQGNDKALKVADTNSNVSRMSETDAGGAELKGNSQQVQQDINLQKQLKVKGSEMQQGSDTNGKPGTEQIQKDIALQEKLNNKGKVPVPGTENRAGTEKIQKEIALQEKLNNKGKAPVPGTENRAGTEQIQKDITMQEQLRNNGTSNPAGSDTKSTSQTISRDVEVKNKVNDGGSVDSPVRGTSQTVHRDVEVKNKVNDGGAVDSPVRGTSQTVHRDIEVKNNINDGGTVDSPVRGTSQTIHRDIQVKDNVHEDTASNRHGVPTFKQRGSIKSRFEQLDDFEGKVVKENEWDSLS